MVCSFACVLALYIPFPPVHASFRLSYNDMEPLFSFADHPTIFFDTHDVCKSDSSHHLTEVNQLKANLNLRFVLFICLILCLEFFPLFVV